MAAITVALPTNLYSPKQISQLSPFHVLKVIHSKLPIHMSTLTICLEPIYNSKKKTTNVFGPQPSRTIHVLMDSIM